MSAATWARGVVADWTLLLVRGLPEAVARDRFDEIASDLWEQQHAMAARGRGPVGIAGAILLRAARGVPADLAWRVAAAARTDRLSVVATPKPWVHLAAPEKPFDQTNGVVDLAGEEPRDDSNPERDFLELGVRMNAINFGPNGGM